MRSSHSSGCSSDDLRYVASHAGRDPVFALSVEWLVGDAGGLRPGGGLLAALRRRAWHGSFLRAGTAALANPLLLRRDPRHTDRGSDIFRLLWAAAARHQSQQLRIG